MNRAPYRRPHGLSATSASDRLLELRYLVNRQFHAEHQRFPLGRVDDGDRSIGRPRVGVDELRVKFALNLFDRLSLAPSCSAVFRRRSFSPTGARFSTSQKTGDFIERTLRRREPDSL